MEHGTLDLNSTTASDGGRADDGANDAAAIDAELAAWQRRAVLWRERALNAQALNEALSENLDDLRTILHHLAVEDADHGASTNGVATNGTKAAAHWATAEQWWNKLWRRDTWIPSRAPSAPASLPASGSTQLDVER